MPRADAARLKPIPGFMGERFMLGCFFFIKGSAMRDLPSHEYQGYTIVINPMPAGLDRVFSTFSIYDRSDVLLPLSQRQVVLHHGMSEAAEFDTEDEAIAHATNYAHEWIDAQLS